MGSSTDDKPVGEELHLETSISGAVFLGYCLGNIVGPLCFTSTPGPRYAGSFISCVVVNACDVPIELYGRWLLRHENRRRDHEYGPLTTGRALLEDLTDRENKDFRYVFQRDNANLS